MLVIPWRANTHIVLALKADITNRSQILLPLNTKLKGRPD